MRILPIIISLCLMGSALCAQDKTDAIHSLEIDAGQKIFTFRNMRTSFGFGISGAVPESGSLITFRGMPSPASMQTDEEAKRTSVTYGLFAGVDMMSPNSLLGLTVLTRLDYALYNFGSTEDSTYAERISMGSFEIPLLIKARPGKRDSKTHGHIALGMSYSFPLTATRSGSLMTDTLSFNASQVLKVIGQFGIDFTAPKKDKAGKLANDRRDTYGQLFIRPSYALNSPFDSEDLGLPTQDFASILSSDEKKSKIREIRIEFGLSVFF